LNVKKSKFNTLRYLKNKTNDENENKKLTIQINKNINFNKLYCMFFINQWCQTTFSDNTYRIFILKKQRICY
ncbi:TPA: hypothetical protein ACM5I9_005401, partial [Escherichia coli]